MKLKLIILIFTTILTLSCHKANVDTKKDIDKVDAVKKTLPKSASATIEKQLVTLRYKKPVNGYRITIKWTLYESYEDISKGLAVIYFKKDKGCRFCLIDSNFVSNIFVTKNGKETLTNDSLIYLDYPPKTKRNILRNDVPFSFEDVDFDGEKELIITVFGEGQRHIDIFRVFKLDSVGNLVKQSKQVTYQKPYIDFDGFTRFDKKDKTVTNTFDGGADNSSYETFVSGSGIAKNNKFRLKRIVEYVDGVKKIHYTKNKLTKSGDYLKMDFENQ